MTRLKQILVLLVMLTLGVGAASWLVWRAFISIEVSAVTIWREPGIAPEHLVWFRASNRDQLVLQTELPSDVRSLTSVKRLRQPLVSAVLTQLSPATPFQVWLLNRQWGDWSASNRLEWRLAWLVNQAKIERVESLSIPQWTDCNLTVVNGTSAAGLAERTAQSLELLGFRVVSTQTNPEPVVSTQLRYRPDQTCAEVIKTLRELVAWEHVTDDSVESEYQADVVLLLGDDLVDQFSRDQ